MDCRKRRTRLGVVAATVTAVLAGALVAHAGTGRDARSGHPTSVDRGDSAASLAVVTRDRSHPDPGGPAASSAAGTHGAPDGRTTALPMPARASADDARSKSKADTVAAAGRRLPVSAPAVQPAKSRPAQAVSPLVAGVGSIPAGWVAAAHSITVGGLSRVYLTVEPAHLSAGLPIVLLMHGREMTPDTVLRISGLADRVGPAVLVVPAGWNRSWNAGDCCGAAYHAAVNDVGFVRAALTAVISATPGGRHSKVYAVGFSNGGRMAYLLACEMPGVISGFVAVEAVPVEACTPPAPLDMTIVAQQSDPLLTVDAGRPKTIYGFTEPTVADTVTRMEAVDHCDGPAVATDSGLAVEQTWDCADGTRVRYVWYPSGAHDWRRSSGPTPGATDYVLQTLGRGPA